MHKKQAKHITVYGKVQGVGFRFFVLQQARENNITGWVRNTADLNVEVHAEGRSEDLAQFIKMLSVGPSLSRVKGLDQRDTQSQNFSYFDIKG